MSLKNLVSCARGFFGVIEQLFALAVVTPAFALVFLLYLHEQKKAKK